MKYRTLGRSGLRVSEISFGCMSLGSDHAVNASLLLNAADAGINYFDTADLYDKGGNEITVGKALKSVRDKVIIATKVGNQWRPDGSGWDWNPTKKYILQAVDASLQRLHTSYIDVYQLHGGMITDPIDETIEAFEQLQQQGKIRHYGISSIRPNVIREYVKRSNIVSVMMQYSLLDRRPEEACISLLHENNIGLLTRGTLAGGLLVDKPAHDYLGYNSGQVHAASTAIGGVTNDTRSKTDAAIQFVLRNEAVTSSVIGIRSEEQLRKALRASDAVLSDDELDVIRNSVPPNRYADHR